ncbi:MAG TPA: BPSS1780 family membrane protein [Solimonas sp.]
MTNVPDFRRVSAGNGLDWITAGFGLFKQAPLLWIALLVLWVIGAGLVSILPFIGSVIVNMTTAAVIGGLLLGAHGQRQGQPLKLETLWAGFQQPHLHPLILLGIAYLVIGVIMGVVVGGLFLASFGSAFIGGSGEINAVSFSIGGLITGIVVLALIAVFSMATWFAPGLIVFAGVAPIDALKQSFAAALANIGALAVYGLLSIVIVIVASIPFGLGLFVAVPVLVIALYCSYDDVFGASAPTPLP